MFVRFDLPCNKEKQKELHKIFRRKIKEWKDLKLVDRAVLTYHYPHPFTRESLYFCVDIPSLKEETEPKVEVSSDTVKQIPPVIMQCINAHCEANNIKPIIMNYKLDIEHSKRTAEQSGQSYYNRAPTEEILKFASIGTEIALKILDMLEENEKTWSSDRELREFIFSKLGARLGSDYEWMHWALHFVCNPLQISEDSIVNPFLNRALTAIRFDP